MLLLSVPYIRRDDNMFTSAFRLPRARRISPLPPPPLTRRNVPNRIMQFRRFIFARYSDQIDPSPAIVADPNVVVCVRLLQCSQPYFSPYCLTSRSIRFRSIVTQQPPDQHLIIPNQYLVS